MLFFLCFSFILTSAAATGAMCPENSQEWESKCYIFVSNNSAFVNAEIHCRSFGGHLASISNAFTNAFIAQQAGYLLQGSGTPDAWLGGTSLIDATNWTWTDHRPFTYSNWANSSAIKGHTCTAIGLANGLWMSDDCFERKPYICLIDSNIATTTTLPQTTISTPTTTSLTTPIETESTSVLTTVIVSSSEATTKTIPLESTTSFIASTVTATTDAMTTTTTEEADITSSATSSGYVSTVSTTLVSQTTVPSLTTPLFSTSVETESTVTGTSSAATSTTSSSLNETSTTTEMTTITSTSPTTPVNPCPQNWTYFAPSSACFYSPLTDFNWTDAEEFCVNRSSHLVSIHSEEELYFFINTFLWGWSGLHKTDGEWKWTDNTPTDYLYWQRGYPQENENSCAHLFGTFWNDHACGDSLPTVCKMVIQ